MPKSDDSQENKITPAVIGSGISVNSGSGYPLHRHPSGELIAVLDGTYHTQIGEQSYALSTGDLLYVPAGLAHEIKAGEPWRTQYLIFDPACFDLPQAPSCRRDDTEEALQLMSLIHSFHHNNLQPEAIVAHLLAALLQLLQAGWRENEEQAHRHPGLLRAMKAIDQEPQAVYDAASLARRARVSVSHLNKLFRAELGCSPLQYQTQVRMRKARRLLLDPYLTVAELARECGWDDVNYFVRRFREHHGLPPRKWARSYGI